jgi:oxygen-dependent protoporphyrinogen oxidase
MSKIAVLGAGVSGLTAAWDLRRNGHEVLALEASDDVGGTIGTERHDGYLLETGPNTIALRGDAPARELLKQTGLLGEAIDASPEASKRFVVRGGRPLPVPSSPPALIRSKLFSLRGKLRLLLEPLLPRGKEPEVETVASFVKRRLGREALDYAVDPFVSGIYTARPESMILRHAFPLLSKLEAEHRSLFLGGMRMAKQRKKERLPKTRLISFRNGLATLPRHLAKDLGESLRTNAPVQKVRREESGWAIEWTENGESREDRFDSALCALPAHKLSAITWENLESEEDLSIVAETPHSPVVVLYQGFRREDVGHPLDGFGFLVPRKENLGILGALFSSTLFPERAPDGHVLLTVFVGGERQPELTEGGDDDLHNRALKDLRSLLDLKADPVFRHLRRWPQAIPVPDVGQTERLAAIQRITENNPGLHWTGSHLAGVSLSDCIEGALKESSNHG